MQPALRAALLVALREGQMPLRAVAQAWSDALLEVAKSVLSWGAPKRLFGGTANRWFRECRTEHAVLREALSRNGQN